MSVQIASPLQTELHVLLILQKGWTPLHFAVMNDRFLMVKYLLEQGADINIPDNACASIINCTILVSLPVSLITNRTVTLRSI